MTHLRSYLKTKTLVPHSRLEALPFFQALQAGSLPALPIVNFLRCMAILHAVLEPECSHVTIPQFTRLAGHATPKVPLLVADLETLRAQTVPSITGVETDPSVAANFGQITSTVNSPRQFQFGSRFTF